MKYDALTIQNAERAAFSMLAEPFYPVPPTVTNPKKFQATDSDSQRGLKPGIWYIPNEFYSQPSYITATYQLVQEIAYTNAGPYQFNFTAVNAPQPSAVANNRVLSVNQTVCIYGIQLLQGEAATARLRNYRSYGITQNDSAIYNSTINMQLETNTLIDGIEGQSFRDTPNSPTESWGNMGLILIQPYRIFNADLGRLFVNIFPNNSLAGLALTANLFLSVRLWCVLGNPNIAK